jgi:hypothetical protein
MVATRRVPKQTRFRKSSVPIVALAPFHVDAKRFYSNATQKKFSVKHIEEL